MGISISFVIFSLRIIRGIVTSLKNILFASYTHRKIKIIQELFNDGSLGLFPPLYRRISVHRMRFFKEELVSEL